MGNRKHVFLFLLSCCDTWKRLRCCSDHLSEWTRCWLFERIWNVHAPVCIHKISIAIYSAIFFFLSWNYMCGHFGGYTWLLLAGYAITMVITLALILFCVPQSSISWFLQCLISLIKRESMTHWNTSWENSAQIWKPLLNIFCIRRKWSQVWSA